jgi:hypothetical protein
MNSDKKTKTSFPARKRRRKSARPKRSQVTPPGREAVQTLVTIMKNEEQPSLQVAAAKVLLSQKDEGEEGPGGTRGKDVDATIVVAKRLLDEFAAYKARHVQGAGGVAVEGASKPDHAAG